MKKIIFTLAAILAFSACNYLDLPVQNVVLTTNYYKTADQCQEALNGVYAILADGNLYGNRMLGRMGLSCDIGYEYYKSDQNNVGYYQTTTTDGNVAAYWRKCYVGIARANMLLENIGRAEGDEATLARIKGEALFLRGYYYYILVKRFGEVPLVLKTVEDINSNEKFVPQAPLGDLYEQIVKDMEDASTLVLPRSEVSEGWQVCQTTCWGMLARVCLNMAGQPLGRVGMYLTASEYAKKVIDSGGHHLNPDFTQIFKNYSGDIYDIEESMFEVNFWGDNTDIYSTAGMVGILIGIPSSAESPIGYCRGVLRVNPYLATLYDDGDVRRDWTISNFTYEASGAHKDASTAKMSARYCAKFRREFESKNSSKNSAYCAINFPILRYADVLLMYTECYAYAGVGDKTLAYECLNQVRRRAHGVEIYEPSFYDYTNEDRSALRKEIQDERARELAYEMLRKDDLCRWGNFYENMKSARNYIDTMDSVYELAAISAYDNVRSRDMLWPIPNREISANPKLNQNNGW